MCTREATHRVHRRARVIVQKTLFLDANVFFVLLSSLGAAVALVLELLDRQLRKRGCDILRMPHFFVDVCNSAGSWFGEEVAA